MCFERNHVKRHSSAFINSASKEEAIANMWRHSLARLFPLFANQASVAADTVKMDSDVTLSVHEACRKTAPGTMGKYKPLQRVTVSNERTVQGYLVPSLRRSYHLQTRSPCCLSIYFSRKLKCNHLETRCSHVCMLLLKQGPSTLYECAPA